MVLTETVENRSVVTETFVFYAQIVFNMVARVTRLASNIPIDWAVTLRDSLAVGTKTRIKLTSVMLCGVFI